MGCSLVPRPLPEEAVITRFLWPPTLAADLPLIAITQRPLPCSRSPSQSARLDQCPGPYGVRVRDSNPWLARNISEISSRMGTSSSDTGVGGVAHPRDRIARRSTTRGGTVTLVERALPCRE